ncbi:hypothetical protein ACIOD1_17705 [Streptomyces sp. NPDC088097]|uniref:hypothetical protein n=1 Tax=Streptomyces sp. NPDC088097 TaxID=3365823 RepID=UPI003815A9F3
MRSTRRKTLRTAAVLTGAAAVLALPVGAAFADSPAAPEPGALPAVEQPSVDPAVQPSVDPSVDPSVRPTAPPVTPPVTPPVQSRGFVTTVKLADGSVAKVYKIGDDHFEADVFSGDTRLDTLVSKDGKPAYGRNNGLHVVLQPNGTVTSWTEGTGEPVEKPKPEPKPKPKPVVEDGKETSVRITMPDGRIAKLVDGPHEERVEISMPNGNLLGTLDRKNPTAMNDGWTYKLVQDRTRLKFVVIDGRNGGDSWVYDFADGRLIEKYTVEKTAKAAKVERVEKPGHVPAPQVTPAKPVAEQRDRIVPKGGVKAGAEGVVEAGRTDTPVLMAAGGGMAAVGAAGLGFALLRRGRARG